MKNIPEGMVKIDERKLLKQGNSLGVTLPSSVIKETGVELGDTISLYTNGKGQVLLDLKGKQRK